MKSTFLLTGLFIASVGFSQQIDSVMIRGLVISKDNYPLQNVTVRVSNTDKVVFSDAFGQFELWTPIEGILEFSCISEPYRISVSSVGVHKKNELLKFEFNLKGPNSSYKTKRLKGRTIKVNDVNPGRLSDIILAYYDTDFERITQKHFDYHRNLNHKIIFMIDGQVLHDNYNPRNLDYSSVKHIAIIRILDSYDKIIFMISSRNER